MPARADYVRGSADASVPPGQVRTPWSRGLAPWARQQALRAGSYLAFAAILLVFALKAPFFLSVGNIGNVLGQSAILAVPRLRHDRRHDRGGGQCRDRRHRPVAGRHHGARGGGLCSPDPGRLWRRVASVGALATGLAVGLFNALAVVGLGIVPLLATLATMNIVAGIELVITQNTVIPADTPFLSLLSGSAFYGIPNLALVLAGVSVVSILAVQFTPVGLRLYAVGEFPEAARAAGLPIKRLVAGSYLVSGLFGGMAAILSVAYLSGSTTDRGICFCRSSSRLCSASSSPAGWFRRQGARC